MKNIVEKNYGEVTVVENSDYKWGVIDSKGNEIVKFGKYDWIEDFEQGLCRVKIGKQSSTRVVKNGIAREVYFHDLNPSLPKRGAKSHNYNDEYLGERKTYDDYNGTYVQDVMRWSDQEINDALDGEPDAYWNID